MEHVVTEYLSYLDIPISKTHFEKCIASHPDYPSLLSIADTLERMGIDHQVGQIDKDKNAIPFPCILQLDRRGGELLLVKSESDLDEDESALDHWDGIILKVEPTDTVTDPKNREARDNEILQQRLTIALVVAFTGLLGLALLQVGSLLYSLLLVTSVGGAIVGYLLLAKDLGVTYKPVETFCNAGKRTNCDRILNAEDATLFGHLTFTDAAASYFIWQLIMLGLFIPLMASGASFIMALAAAALGTLPVMGYSLYYQYAKAKTWCRLCLIIDGVLGVQAVVLGLMYINKLFALSDFMVVPVITAVVVFVGVCSSIMLLKTRLQQANETIRAETTAKRVKYDPQIFMENLSGDEKMNVRPFEPEMRIGSLDAPVQILMVINLHCHPCSIAFKTVQSLTQMYPEKLCFSIRMLHSGKNAIGKLPASSYLIRYWHQHIYKQEEESILTRNLLDDWYDEMDPERFAQQYPSNGEVESENSKGQYLEIQHYEWITENGITRTPTFFINGHKMPKNYIMNDLTAMGPGLADMFQEQQKLTNKELV